MKPKSFPEVNQIYAKDQPEYNPLPVFKDEKGTVVSCWELSDDEIDKIKANKCIWLSVMTFNQPLQPLFMTADKEDILTPIETDLEECIESSEKLSHQVATNLPASTSLEGCPFHYCDKNPVCENKCRYDKN